MNSRKKHIGFARIKNALGYSLDGIKQTYRSESAFRQECWLCLVLLPLPWLMQVDGLRIIILYTSLLLVLIVELVNTAIETLVERISPEIHPLSKKAKDVGSAAVFLTLIMAMLVWAGILFFGV